MNNERWLLPEGIDELLPPQAARLEDMRRRLLDLFQVWGYELVMPPLVEYLDSLLTGTGNDLDIQTFKLTDQMSGRLMGVRADITPQVARIDAHRMGDRQGPVRLCYQGTVLHTRGDSFGGSRCFTQIGAELYGHAGVESDIEMLSLMLETLSAACIDDVYIDVGHVGIYRALSQAAGLSVTQEATLFDALQRKAVPEVESLVAGFAIDNKLRQQFIALVWLNGDESILAEARERLAGHAPIDQALDAVEKLATQIKQRYPALQLHFDLAELRGFHYHTGIVFAAYQAGRGRAIAQGGRYDDIGQVFGRARPATGFSADLRSLVELGTCNGGKPMGVFAPADVDAALMAKINELRAAGQRVVLALPGQEGGAKEAGCDQELILQGGQWVVQ